MKAEQLPIDAELVDQPRATRMISPGETSASTADGAKEAAIDVRIEDARHSLSTRLSELERRVEYVKTKVDPRAWVQNPWARIGIAAAVGFAIGRSEVLQPIVRAALGTALRTLFHQAAARLDV